MRFILILGLWLQELTWAQQVPEFNAPRAFGFLEEQCALGPRNPGSEGHREGLRYILNSLSPHADTVIAQSFPFFDPYTNRMLELTNVIAQFNRNNERRVWLAAHWDTRPWADLDENEKNRNRPILGANDGASGVAVLLELAHHFGRVPPPLGVDLVFLDGEDSGKGGDLKHFFNGSRYLAQNIPSPVPEYCILIDMVGDRVLELPIEGNSNLQAPDLVKEVWGLAERLGLTPFRATVEYWVDDDHVILFEKAGIPSIDIIDFRYPDSRSNYWHTLEDTPDKCSAESLKVVGTLLLHHIYGDR